MAKSQLLTVAAHAGFSNAGASLSPHTHTRSIMLLDEKAVKTNKITELLLKPPMYTLVLVISQAWPTGTFF